MNTLAQSAKQNKFTPTTNTSNLQVQRKCACGGASKLGGQCSECEKKKLVGGNVRLIQPKLKISQPNDKYELEADRVADEVMRMPEPKVQRQVKPGEEKEAIQRKPIASQITPLVQRQPADDKPKSNGEETKEALKKTGEAFLETAPGKAIVKKGEEVVTSLPGMVIAGTAAVGAVTALIATNKALPIQAPAIPLDKLHPGLSMSITVEGPLRAPTKAMISFSGKFGFPKRFGHKKSAKTESEKLREENIRMRREQFEFRESLKTPEEKARDQDFLNSFILQGMKNPSNPLFIPGLKFQEDVPVIEKKKEKETVQRKETKNSMGDSADTSMVREVVQSAGQTLDSATRGFMEQRFGYDFSQVRIHADNRAAASAQSLNARAYTLGQDIVFGTRQYSPGTQSGQKLLAHELTHVMQQNQSIESMEVQRWSVTGNTATSDKSSDTLGRLAQLQGGRFNDWKCIKPILMKTFETGKQTAYQKANYELYVQIGDQFDFSNITATTGETLRYYLFDDTSEKLNADIVKLFYSGSAMGTGGDSDIDTNSDSGSKPIQNMLIFAHSSGGEMWGAAGSFIPSDYEAEGPKQNYAVANAGLFPRRCWFTRNASVRAVGCNSLQWGNDFAKVFLRNGASITATTESVQPQCRGKGYDRTSRTCNFYNGLAFAAGSSSSSPVVRGGGPFWSVTDFHDASHWGAINGKL